MNALPVMRPITFALIAALMLTGMPCLSVFAESDDDSTISWDPARLTGDPVPYLGGGGSTNVTSTGTNSTDSVDEGGGGDGDSSQTVIIVAAVVIIVGVAGWLFWRHHKSKQKTTINMEASQPLFEHRINDTLSLTFDVPAKRGFGGEWDSFKETRLQDYAKSDVALRVRF